MIEMARTIIEMARTMIIHSDFPAEFWIDASYTATYTINRLPSSVLGVFLLLENYFIVPLPINF